MSTVLRPGPRFSLWLLAWVVFASGYGYGASGHRMGVLFASYGDVDKPEEVENYVKSALRDSDIAPIPGFLKGLVANLGWLFEGRRAIDEYRLIGGSHYRATASRQADLVREELASLGTEAATCTAFIFTTP